MSAEVECFLIVSARGEVKVSKTTRNLKWDEVAFPVTVEIPEAWGTVYEEQTIALSLPEAAPTARVGGVQIPEPDDG